MKLVQPPDVKRNAAWLAVFWFLHWHEAKFGEPFTFNTQRELADAVGVAPSVITRLKKAAPNWIEFTERSARVKGSNE